MSTLSLPRLNIPWAIVIGAVFISGTIIYSSSAIPILQMVGTFSLVVLAVISVRTARRIEWFTGAMQRHSDQQRQIAARRAKVATIWWDPTKEEAGGHFPEGGKHSEEFFLETIYIGLPPHLREKKPTGWQRFWGAR